MMVQNKERKKENCTHNQNKEGKQGNAIAGYIDKHLNTKSGENCMQQDLKLRKGGR